LLLNKLEVYKTVPYKEMIRHIDFNLNGLNLIVDNTTDVKQDTGNSVGKSTVIHIIDICLNSSSLSKLYKNRDAQGENIKLKNLLEENKVRATLEIIHNGKSYSFTRSLYKRGPRLINNKKVKESEYESFLKELLFNSKEDKPTFRQLISKFVRTDEIQLNNIIYYLTSTSYIVYEAIYLFLLGINDESIISERQKLEEKLAKLEAKSTIYQNDPSIPSLDQIEQGLMYIESEIQDLIEKRNQIDYLELYKKELEKNSEINSKLDNLLSEIELLEFERNTIKKSLTMINESKSNIDIEIIKQIYLDAKAFNEKLNKQFEDVLKFHNQMVENRSKFIEKQLKKVEDKLKVLKKEQADLIDLKKSKSIELIDEGLLIEFNNINVEIENMNIKKGELLKAKEIQESLKNEFDTIKNELKQINEKAQDDDHLLPLKEFNDIFKKYSDKLYGEKYILYYDSEWREKKDGRPFSIGNLMGNIGTGNKRGLMIAFDMAYITYAKSKGIVAPRFLIYDQLENTHINQLGTIIELSKEIDGQLIFPILRERVKGIHDDIIEKSKIIELSQSNKFFRI
jgi:uncharacterized protein YydD (DUF2326 family)